MDRAQRGSEKNGVICLVIKTSDCLYANDSEKKSKFEQMHLKNPTQFL